MKIASFTGDGQAGYGIVEGDDIVLASSDFRARYPALKEVLAGDALFALQEDVRARSAALPLHEITLLPPIPDAGKIVCVGMNYAKIYPLDDAPPPPGNIVLFGKHNETLVGHGAALEIPEGDAAASFDYEGEIAVIVGKPGRHIPPERAREHIAGYSILNDGSVRAWQKHSVHAGKNFANSGSCGPWMVTADEVDDPEAMALTTRLNGKIVQQATARDMIFSIPRVMAYISHLLPLNPGDIIATGSPDGSGGGRRPPRFLVKGDLLEIEVSGIGTLTNPVKVS